MRHVIAILFVVLCITAPARAQHATVSDIAGTWSGLDKSTVAKQLSKVHLKIDDISGTQTIEGTLTSTIVPTTLMETLLGNGTIAAAL